MQTQDPTQLRVLRGHKESIMALDLHPKCRYVASAGMDSSFFVWDLRNQVPPRKFERNKGHVQDLKIHPNGGMIASSYSDGAIRFSQIDNETKQVTITKAHNSKVRSIAYSCDGNLLVSAGDDKLVKIWSTIDRRLQGQYKKHDNWVRCCEFSPIAKSLISCDDRFVYIWDVATKKVLQEYKEHTGVIHQVKFHSLGNIAASCSHDKKIKLYDMRANQVIQVYEGHEGPVKTFDFHPHTAHLISSSEDGTTKIWNTQMNRLQYTIQAPSNKTRFSREGDYFVTGGIEKTIYLWKTGFYDSFKQKIIGVEFTPEQSREKVKYQVKEAEKRQTSSQSEQVNKIKQKSQKGTMAQTGNQNEYNPSILYCHDKQNFQTQNLPQKAVELKKSPIPVSLQRKLQQMSMQIDFITKTTQILEARVLNNGEHLRRLVQMVEMGGSLNQKEEY